VIQSVYDMVVFYYARFDNVYLRKARMYGKDLKKMDPTATAQLHHSKRYHLRVARERVECFEELTRILWYIARGRTERGFFQDFRLNLFLDPVFSSEFNQ